MNYQLDRFSLNSAMFIQPRYIAQSAWHGHIPFAAWLTATVRPRRFVELGSHWGASYTAFCQTVAEYGTNTRCYAVDTWQGDEHAGFYPEVVFQTLDAFNRESFAGFSSLMRMTFDEAVSSFEDGSIDLLHIDGLHTYEAVRHDFETWLPKMSDRGIVLFHDISVRGGDFGVWKFWEELTPQYPHLAFDHSAGLGVLFVGGNQTDSARALIRQIEDAAALQVIRQMFAALGESVVRQYELAVARHERNETVQQMQRQIEMLTADLAKRDTSPEAAAVSS